MFTKSIIALAAVASFAVAAPVEKRGPPAGWAYGYLEDYDTYHIRYLALKCQDQHKTQFFQDCCRPMLATENLKDNRKDYCRPSKEATQSVAASLSAKPAGGATPTASADQETETEYCESESSASSAGVTQAPQTPAAAASSSSTTTTQAAQTEEAGKKYVAPAPSSSTTTTQAWTPAPTTQAPTTQAPAPTTQAPKQNNGGGQFSGGYATYFYQGGNAGACGAVHGDYDMIVAIDHEKWGSDSFGHGSDTCGRWLTITNTNNGKSVSAMVADVCPTCANGNSLDLSVGAFNAIASPSEGMVPISWSWN